MGALRELLTDTSGKHLQTAFQTIAEELMCNYVIQKGGRQYVIVEIEFYYYSPEHRDVITYPRKMEAGRWFFHQSGVDLTFNSFDIEQLVEGKFKLGENARFGGVLIRGLRRLDNGDYIFGPQKCVNELWSDFDAFGISTREEYPILKEHKAISSPNLKACKRYINIKGGDKDEHQLSKIREWARRLNVDWDNNAIRIYKEDVFANTEKYLYRYFNLPNYEFSTLKNIPPNARPKGMKTI